MRTAKKDVEELKASEGILEEKKAIVLSTVELRMYNR
jgi:hypothetical protein